MGIPLARRTRFRRARRALRAAADPNPQLPPPYKVAIVNESYAKHYFGDRSPIGRHIGFGINPGTKTPIEIIGVVKDAKYTGVRDDIPRQVFFAFMENDFAGGAVMYVRTTNQPGRGVRRDPPGGAPARREHPDLQPAHARTSDRSVAAERSPDRDAVDRVRRAGDAARGDRALRRDGVHGRAAHARDRRAHGARRRAGRRRLAGDARGADARRQRHRPRAGGGVGPGPAGQRVSCTASPPTIR